MSDIEVKVVHIGLDYGKVVVVDGDTTTEYEVQKPLAIALKKALA